MSPAAPVTGIATVALLILTFLASASAAPRLPTDDSQVLEHLPSTVADSEARELRALRQALVAEPDNLTLAVQLASKYIEIGRSTGDPRYSGYAQSALSFWWGEPFPPLQILVLRAQLRQRVHEFPAALADLDLAIKTDPRESRARLLRATIGQVTGDYDSASGDCAVLEQTANRLFGVHCRASILSMTGSLPQGYALLKAEADNLRSLDAATAAWILTSLAEMADRLGHAVQASALFRRALELTPADQYLLISYADFLLAEGRAHEVLPLLAPYPRVDGLLLRYALALNATGADTSEVIAQLRARFAASTARGETVHQREQARFALDIEHAAPAAVTLALDNWTVQKESADLRILVGAAHAAKNTAALETAKAWITQHRYQDRRLDEALQFHN